MPAERPQSPDPAAVAIALRVVRRENSMTRAILGQGAATAAKMQPAKSIK